MILQILFGFGMIAVALVILLFLAVFVACAGLGAWLVWTWWFGSY